MAAQEGAGRAQPGGRGAAWWAPCARGPVLQAVLALASYDTLEAGGPPQVRAACVWRAVVWCNVVLVARGRRAVAYHGIASLERPAPAAALCCCPACVAAVHASPPRPSPPLTTQDPGLEPSQAALMDALWAAKAASTSAAPDPAPAIAPAPGAGAHAAGARATAAARAAAGAGGGAGGSQHDAAAATAAQGLAAAVFEGVGVHGLHPFMRPGLLRLCCLARLAARGPGAPAAAAAPLDALRCTPLCGLLRPAPHAAAPLPSGHSPSLGCLALVHTVHAAPQERADLLAPGGDAGVLTQLLRTQAAMDPECAREESR